ncbi:MAG: hypothetical protein NW215_02105 [Hyphomicrobiales bacterium]|nr:hypothetical protein [Hyphomicrobiales bacterium]
MKIVKSGLGAAALAAVLAYAPATPAKADGGATAVGVGAYLVVDYVVGRKCHMHYWPFNIVKKIAYGVKHKRVCKYRKH